MDHNSLNSLLLEYLEFATISYENENDGNYSLEDKCNSSKFYDAREFSKVDAQFYTIYKNNEIIFAIRGSSSVHDFWNDFEINLVNAHDITNSTSKESKELVHKGFLNQYNAIIKQVIHTISMNAQYKITFVGHSLGGALATMCALKSKLTFKNRKVCCITFGSPRVGNFQFVTLFNNNIDLSYRCVNNYDAVTMRPYWGYEHVGKEIKIGNKPKPWFLYFGYIEDHYLENYNKSLCGTYLTK